MNQKIQNIDAVILVGGKNRRFKGKQKSLALLKGKPILDHQLEVLKPLFQKIYLIANNKKEFQKYSELEIVEDIIKDKGPLSGIHSGITHSKNQAVFVFAGDMPFINKKLILKQIDIFQRSNFKAIIPKTEMGLEPLHAIYETNIEKIIEDLILETSNLSVRDLLNRTDTFHWEIPPEKAFININSLEELKKYV